ncbi:type II secretion system protein [Facilibium subflavum]|uniref:type II secretion system protein n=1 Tax=Facilibium subflavum TaxID=2219058 RepID=UPI000E64B757|nr:type II secretion system protein [Facilibium subflavum]
MKQMKNNKVLLRKRNHLGSYSRQKGYSLVELMIVLAVIAGLIAVVVVTARSLWASSKSTTMYDSVIQLEQNVKSLYTNASGVTDYTNIKVADVIGADAVPSTLPIDDGSKSGAATIETIWGEDTSIDLTAGTPKSVLELTIKGVPTGACTDLVGKLYPISQQARDVSSGQTAAAMAAECKSGSFTVDLPSQMKVTKSS